MARRWADVTSTDYAEALLENGKRRAAADKLDIAFEVADAKNLPFEALDTDARGSLEADITAILDKFNIADDDTLVMPAEYVEVVISLK